MSTATKEANFDLFYLSVQMFKCVCVRVCRAQVCQGRHKASIERETDKSDVSKKVEMHNYCFYQNRNKSRDINPILTLSSGMNNK